jgi:hypothetical protein
MKRYTQVQFADFHDRCFRGLTLHISNCRSTDTIVMSSAVSGQSILRAPFGKKGSSFGLIRKLNIFFASCHATVEKESTGDSLL